MTDEMMGVSRWARPDSSDVKRRIRIACTVDDCSCLGDAIAALLY